MSRKNKIMKESVNNLVVNDNEFAIKGKLKARDLQSEEYHDMDIFDELGLRRAD